MELVDKVFGCNLFLYWLYFAKVVGQNTSPAHPDTLLSSTELIEKYGYPCEVHEIITEDNFILTMYRIPHGKHDKEDNSKPILMMHGLFGTSDNFVISAMKNSSMAFYFADQGYDVWLGNNRGNIHSRTHKILDPEKSKFWQFDWHELGIYDLPAMIDHVLWISGKQKLNFIGHSQGGTIFYVMTSLKPEYQQKIIQASLLAPAGYMKHFHNAMLTPFLKNINPLLRVVENAKIYEFPPPWINFPKLLFEVCSESFLAVICPNVLTQLNGGDSKETDPDLISQMVRFVSTASSFQLIHYAQNIIRGRFCQWDYGKKKNMEIYRSSEPPDYPIKNIEVPIAIYYSEGDNLASPKDIENICDSLPNCTRMYKMPNLKWTHLDFVFSKNLVKKLLEPLMKYMQLFD